MATELNKLTLNSEFDTYSNNEFTQFLDLSYI